MGPQQIGLAVAPGEIAHHPIMEEIERVQMDHVEAGNIGFQRPAHRPGGEPDLGMLQGEEADLHAVAHAFARQLRRLAEIGGIDRHLMAAPRHGARHFEACLGGPAAFGRQIADDVENAQKSTPRYVLNARGQPGVPGPAQPIADAPAVARELGGAMVGPPALSPRSAEAPRAFHDSLSMIPVIHVAADLGQGGTERSIELLATAARGAARAAGDRARSRRADGRAAARGGHPRRDLRRRHAGRRPPSPLRARGWRCSTARAGRRPSGPS